MFNRRVVVTGMGILSPVGNTVNEAWEHIRQGRSGIRRIENWDASGLGVQIAGEVRDFDPEARFGRREARRSDRITQLAWAATQQALEDANLTITDANRYDTGVLIGTGSSGLTSVEEGVLSYHNRGPKAVSPILVPKMLPDAPSAKISIEYGIHGPNMQLASACATGNNAIGEAAAWIARGVADVMVAGSTEGGVIPLAVASFDNLTAISTRNDEPEKASRPFDKNRDGFVMAEGAAIVILEALEHAQQRGAHIYGEIIGYGMSSDAYHVTAPDESGRGAKRAMDIALKSAQVDVTDIDYINAHGTSTPYNDRSETLAIKAAFGEHAYRVPISSTKSMTGHLMSASGAIEAVICLKAMQDNFMPPTINLETPDPDCDLDYIPNVGRDKTLEVVMSNAFGFGGHNVVLIFRKYHGN